MFKAPSDEREPLIEKPGLAVLALTALTDLFVRRSARRYRDTHLTDALGHWSNIIWAFPKKEHSFIIRQMYALERCLAQYCNHHGIAVHFCEVRSDIVLPSSKSLADKVSSWVNAMKLIMDTNDYGKAHFCVAQVLVQLGIGPYQGATIADGPPPPTVFLPPETSAYNSLGSMSAKPAEAISVPAEEDGFSFPL